MLSALNQQRHGVPLADPLRDIGGRACTRSLTSRSNPSHLQQRLPRPPRGGAAGRRGLAISDSDSYADVRMPVSQPTDEELSSERTSRRPTSSGAKKPRKL